MNYYVVYKEPRTANNSLEVKYFNSLAVKYHSWKTTLWEINAYCKVMRQVDAGTRENKKTREHNGVWELVSQTIIVLGVGPPSPASGVRSVVSVVVV